MTRLLPLLFAASLSLTGGAQASPDTPVTPEVQAQIRTLLEAEGYKVRSIQSEDGMFEAYALRDGERFEIYLDSAMRIVRTERDD